MGYLKHILVLVEKGGDESATQFRWEWEFDIVDASIYDQTPEKDPKKSRTLRKALTWLSLILAILYYGFGVGKEDYKIIRPILYPGQSSSAPPMQPKPGPPTNPLFSPLPELLQKEDPYQIDIDADMDLELMEEGVRLFYAEAYFKRGAHLWRIGRYNQALKAFTKAKLLNPNLSQKIQQMYSYP